MNKNNNNGHRKRLKEKYEKAGLKALHDYEILELLLIYAIPRKDCKPIAKDLMSRFQTIGRVLKASPSELLQVDGLGESTITFINFLNDINRIYLKEKVLAKNFINSTEELIEFLQQDIGNSAIENFKLIYLSTRNEFLGEETICEGTIDKSYIYIREMLKKILNMNAKSVIFVHNHPSGEVKPSNADIKLTNHCKLIFEKLEINLLDHIIISKDSFFSFLENKIL